MILKKDTTFTIELLETLKKLLLLTLAFKVYLINMLMEKNSLFMPLNNSMINKLNLLKN
jgi:hypothetical protein